MKKILLLAGTLGWLSFLFAQNDLSGIINSYTPVSAIDECTATLTVASTDGFSVGLPVLLIQMQGATINTDNSSAFGTVTDLGGAGLFERGTIAAINGNTITLENLILNDYDLAGGVQLVSFPRYDEATVSGPVRAQPWDGSSGGVVAFEVTGTLRLQAPVQADGAGFRGGRYDDTIDSPCNGFSSLDEYRYNLGNWRGGPKGEGIAAPILNMEAGRGPQANGGGGGNDHNSGGGGGANVTAGGLGGRNGENGFFRCKGNFPGLGGRALLSTTDRLFFGGGGGAGHENNTATIADAGNGGGIVLILALTIEGGGQVISANGATPATNPGNDGAAGGGGGGTVIIEAGNLSGMLTIEARGGDGGNVDNRNIDRCFGPGGGGSGGRILTNLGSSATINLQGGAAGLSTNSTACGTSSNGATPGVNGRLETPVTIPESTETAMPPSFTSQPAASTTCPGGSATITATAAGAGLTYQWQVDRGSGFSDLSDDATYNGTTSPSLTINAVSQSMVSFRYRLRVSSACFAPLTSETTTITLEDLPTPAFGYSINGRTVTFDNQSSMADSFSWDFGDGNTSAETNPTYSYPAGGEYTVTLTATNDCGSEDAQVMITLQTPPVAAFQAQPSTGCPTLTVTFDNQSSDNADSFQWSFPGGQPESSSDRNPVVTYPSPGTFAVELVATNGEGNDTSRIDDAVRVLDPPVAGFSTFANEQTVTFTNNSSGADTFSWDFGDGNSSSEFGPVHTYAADGTYTVTLTASGECGPDVLTQQVVVSTLPQAAFQAQPSTGCPALTVTFDNQSSDNADSFQWSFPGGQPESSSDRNPLVTYASPGTFAVELIATNSDGSDTFRIDDAVTVFEPPMAGFSSFANEQTVTFTNNSSGADTFSWDFGDGNSSSEFGPVHTYAADGTYTVTLTASGECGPDVLTQQVVVSTLPQAAFQAQPSTGCPSLTVTFDNQSSDNADTFLWSFPGGQPESSSDRNPVVTYASPGTFAVELIATNSDGSDTFRIDDAVTVLDPPQAGFSTTINEQTVTFTNNSSGADTFSWDFGDGNSSSEFGPVHTYAADGTYSVTLTASGECGPDVLTQQVVVSTLPQAAFQATPESGCRPQTVQLENQSSVNALSFQWSFPGGEPATSTDRNPVVTYDFPGTYDIQLIATNAEGSDTLRRPGIITIADRPAAGFLATTDQRTLTFNNTTAGTADTFSWDFGDGNSSTDANPQHTYQQAGFYTVTLTASNNCGMSETTQQVTAGTSPQANFTADYANGCEPHLIRFSNTSTGDYKTYEWTFPGGEPATSTEAAPQVLYREAGEYDVTLTIDGPLGDNRLTRNLFVKVRSFPEPEFSVEIKGDTIVLTNDSNGANRYLWDFGDGNTSTEEEPVHVYAQGGVYTITLNAQNESCANALSEVVAITLTAVDEVFGAEALRIFPNPTAGTLFITISDITLAPLQGQLFDTQGQVLWQQLFTGDDTIDLSAYPAGLYYLVLQKDEKRQVMKVIKQ